MSNTGQKKIRMLEIFFRAMKGEDISVKNLASQYKVSEKSISRDISEIKNFLSECRDIVGNTELKYSANTKSYHLEFDIFLLNKELVSFIKVLIGCRAFNKKEIKEIVTKLEKYTSKHDQNLLDKIITRELYHYQEVGHECDSVIENVWTLTRCIDERTEITITYYKVSYELEHRRLMPMAITFSEYYFYLIACPCDVKDWEPLYFRVDRITHIVEHRKHFEIPASHEPDEETLRNKIWLMTTGEYRKIGFEYTGNAVQAILDKFPMARIVSAEGDRVVVEAETFGTGVNMFLLSQGSRVKALYPQKFVDEMRHEVENMYDLYGWRQGEQKEGKSNIE